MKKEILFVVAMFATITAFSQATQPVHLTARCERTEAFYRDSTGVKYRVYKTHEDRAFYVAKKGDAWKRVYLDLEPKAVFTSKPEKQ